MKFTTPEGEAYDLVEVPDLGEAMLIKQISGHNLKDIDSSDPFVMFAFVLISVMRKHREWDEETCRNVAHRVSLDQIVNDTDESEDPKA